jgi:hypothetical protein
MAELTDEQIMEAAKSLCKTSGNKWDNLYLGQTKSYLAMAVAAAPFLQLSWDEPSMNEANAIERNLPRQAPPCDQLMRALSLFVSHRNSILVPNPVDPRKEVIVRVLSEQPKDAWYKDTADRILAALGEVK